MNRSMKYLVITSIMALGLAGCSGGETAEEIVQPEIVKERQANFKKFGAAFKALKEELALESPSAAAVAPHVANLASLAPEIPTWFPEGTAEGTEALPTIWEQPEEFEQKAMGLSAAAQLLQAAVDTDDAAALGEAFGEAGKACKACHDTFRQKK